MNDGLSDLRNIVNNADSDVVTVDAQTIKDVLNQYDSLLMKVRDIALTSEIPVIKKNVDWMGSW